MFLLDTNICVHLLKGEYDVAGRISNVGPQSCYISEITLAELLYGIENSSPNRRPHNKERFADFRNLFAGRILSISNALAEYARQKARLRQMGRPVGDFDLLIGSTAAVTDLILVTRNLKDFAKLEGIKIENWIG